jgi:hypothetical protein
MTDEEKKEAGEAYLDWVSKKPNPHRRDDLAFDAGYDAGLKAARQESLYNELKNSNDHFEAFLVGRASGRDEARVQTMKLIKFLDDCANGKKMPDWKVIRETIKEYELLK